MKTWYRVKHWNGGRFGRIEVKDFTVIKETPHTVTYKEPSSGLAHTDGFRDTRENKCSTDHSWYPTLEEAMKDATDRVNNYIRNAEARIREGKENLKALREYVESKDTDDYVEHTCS